MNFDPSAPDDFASEAIFDAAIGQMGGKRAAEKLGKNLQHANADWLFEADKFVVEHKQLESDLTLSSSFQERAFNLRVGWARRGQATVFGVPYNWNDVSREWLELYKRPIAQIVKKANKQIRTTRQQLGWPKGQGVLVISNRNLKEIHPLGICLLMQQILEGSCSEIGGVVYITNHYLHVPGSDLAQVVWYPIYRCNEQAPPQSTIDFIDEFGRGFFRYLNELYPDMVGGEVPHQTDAALQLLKATTI